MTDPMRSEPGVATVSRCPACDARGLADLRHTATADALCELEGSDNGMSITRRVGRVLGFAAAVASLVAVGALMTFGGGGPEQAGLAMAPITLVSLPMLLALGTGISEQGRRLPRRWRLAQQGKGWGKRPRERVRGKACAETELLRAPLSGQLCLGYELGVRDDDDDDGDLDSWRLLEQANVDFRVGEVAVARNAALLQLPRARSEARLLMSSDETTRRAMRMRGLPEGEAVRVYETVLLAGETVAVGRREAGDPMQVLAR